MRALLLTLFVLPAHAQISPPSPVVAVSGTATLTVAPDLVDIDVAVNSFSDRLGKALDDNERRMTAVLAAIRALGVPAKDLRTDQLRVSPRSERGRRVGHDVSRSISVTLRDLDQFEALMKAMFAAGVTTVRRTEFGTSQAIELKQQARLQAIRAARDKARALANAIGQDIGPALSISELSHGGAAFDNFSMNRGGQALGGSTVAVGRVKVTATLTARFALRQTLTP